LLFSFSPHPHVKHYHIKQNSRGEFFLSEKHCCGSIPDLVNYHRHNSGGLASRLKTSPCDRPVPATAGLSHGMYKLIMLPFPSCIICKHNTGLQKYYLNPLEAFWFHPYFLIDSTYAHAICLC
jgi:hypothetical protein